jgi:hypothetical protein
MAKVFSGRLHTESRHGKASDPVFYLLFPHSLTACTYVASDMTVWDPGVLGSGSPIKPLALARSRAFPVCLSVPWLSLHCNHVRTSLFCC